MPAVVHRLLGPALLCAAIAAVWAAVTWAPASAPRLATAASSQEVARVEPLRPARAEALSLAQVGDRVRLTVRHSGSRLVLDLAPGVRTDGLALRELRVALRSGRTVPLLLRYDATGAVTAISSAR